jgi:uncharacterized membrane protein
VSISTITRVLKFVLVALLLLYFYLDFAFQKELMIVLVCIASILVIVDGTRFGIKEKDSIELGEKHDFRKSPIFRFVFPLVILGFVLLVWKSSQWDWWPKGIDRNDSTSFFPLIVGIPQFIEGIIQMIYWESKTIYYATEKGLMISLRGDEVKEWNDFYSYSILEDQDLIQFKKKDLKYLSIQYDAEYFHKYKKEITSFLDQKLTKA